MRRVVVLLALVLFLVDPGVYTFAALMYADLFDWRAVRVSSCCRTDCPIHYEAPDA